MVSAVVKPAGKLKPPIGGSAPVLGVTWTNRLAFETPYSAPAAGAVKRWEAPGLRFVICKMAPVCELNAKSRSPVDEYSVFEAGSTARLDAEEGNVARDVTAPVAGST